MKGLFRLTVLLGFCLLSSGAISQVTMSDIWKWGLVRKTDAFRVLNDVSESYSSGATTTVQVVPSTPVYRVYCTNSTLVIFAPCAQTATQRATWQAEFVVADTNVSVTGPSANVTWLAAPVMTTTNANQTLRFAFQCVDGTNIFANQWSVR